MTADTKPRRFRFSLRSLILLVALAGSGYGLWARWEPWVLVKKGREQERMVYITHVPKSVLDCLYEDGRWVPETDVLWYVYYGDNSRLALLYMPDFDLRRPPSLQLRMRDSGRLIHSIALPTRDVDNFEISRNGTRITTWSTGGYTLVFRRRRPEYWWGVAWLPEFWLTLVLSGGLAWSLWRDRKIGKA